MPQLLAGRAEWRTVLLGNQVIHSQVLTSRAEPAQYGRKVIIAFTRVDCAEQRVLEEPIEKEGRIVMEKIRLRELGGEAGCSGAFD